MAFKEFRQYVAPTLWTRDATGDVSNADLGTEDVDGIVGTDLLRSYELWFDYLANAVHPAPREALSVLG